VRRLTSSVRTKLIPTFPETKEPMGVLPLTLQRLYAWYIV